MAGFEPNLTGMIIMWPFYMIVQIVLVRCISRSHRLNIDFRDRNLKIFLSETKRPTALIFSMVAPPGGPLPGLFK